MIRVEDSSGKQCKGQEEGYLGQQFSIFGLLLGSFVPFLVQKIRNQPVGARQ